MGTRPLRKQQLNKRTGPGSTLPLPRTDVIPEAVRDPLTPLHRLHRFKKIRDRNLKREQLNKGLIEKRTKVVKKKTMETDKATTNIVVTGGEVGTGKSDVSDVPQKVNSKTAVTATHKVSESEKHNGQKAENGTISEEEDVGKRTRSSSKNLSEGSESVAQPEEPSTEEEAVHGKRTRSTRVQSKPSKAEVSEQSEDGEDNPPRHSPRRASPASARPPLRSYRDSPKKEKTPPSKKMEDKEEEVKIDIEEEEEEDDDNEEEEEQEQLLVKKEEKKEEPPRDKTPDYKVLRRSMRIEALSSVRSPSPPASTSAPNSIASYMTSRETFSAYRRSSPRESYLGRVTGRRPVRGYLTPFRSKRKAEDEEVEKGRLSSELVKRRATEVGGDAAGESPSWVRTPGWRYVPSFNKFWSPRPQHVRHPQESSPVLSSSPYQSSSSLSPIFSESMVVNYDEKTTRDFMEADMNEDSAPTTSSSKWYCNVM